jgi:hypothetical protein
MFVLSEEKVEKFYTYGLEFNPEEVELLKKIGLERIKNDADTLVEYAVRKLIEDFTMQVLNEVDTSAVEAEMARMEEEDGTDD